MLKKILLTLLVLFIIIQFIRPEANVHEGPQSNSIFNRFPASPEVKGILRKACLDCHSNNTVYPWYSKIQPSAWWLNDHIKEGKKELNFDEFLSYSPTRQYKKMEQTISMVKKNIMPLKSYTWIHKDAILSAHEKELLVQWADSIQASFGFPIDRSRDDARR
jgi:hypothetical protein